MADKVRPPHEDIELSRPLTIAGAEVKTLRMREPTVADQLAADAAGKTEAQKELAFMANLCEVSVDDLQKMALRDFKKLQDTFLGFME